MSVIISYLELSPNAFFLSPLQLSLMILPLDAIFDIFAELLAVTLKYITKKINYRTPSKLPCLNTAFH